MEMNKTDAFTTSGTFENPPEQQKFMDSFLTNKLYSFVYHEQNGIDVFCSSKMNR